MGAYLILTERMWAWFILMEEIWEVFILTGEIWAWLIFQKKTRNPSKPGSTVFIFTCSRKWVVVFLIINSFVSAWNYGHMASVIAHELSHTLDSMRLIIDDGEFVAINIILVTIN